MLAKPTRVSSVPDLSAPRPIGRATVERMLDDNFGRVKKESGKALWVGIAAVFMIAAVGMATFLYQRHSAEESARRSQEQQLLLLQMAQTVKQQPSDDAAVRSQMDKLSGAMKKIIAQNQALRQSMAGSADGQGGGADQGQQDHSANYNAGLAQATKLYKANDFAKAYAQCVQISQLDPQRWEGYYVAGLSAEALNDSGVALAAYKSALAQAPDDQARSTINQMINAMQTGAGGQAN
jgi:tetratricopeptide (TPR) repeat protein